MRYLGPVKIDNQVWRIFPLEDDVLMLNAICDKHKVKLTLGGDPDQATHVAHSNFQRTIDGEYLKSIKWVVAYLSGSYVGLTNVEDEWEYLLHNGKLI
jgi:hypothetical protein